jgi:dTDP-4-dehydrorhamnose 3,5-epimerase
VIIEPKVFGDDRGWFMESFNEQRFHCGLQSLGLALPPPFVQDNHSLSQKGVLRGLHFQAPPRMQAKLVRVLRGAVFDVVVDLREGSPTFGQWIGVELSETNKRMVWIPEGFAHGFLVLEDKTEFFYKTTDFYDKESEACLRWDDPNLAIAWPLKNEPILSIKDSQALLLAEITKLPYARPQEKKELIDLRVIGDSRGSLIALEKGSNLPFHLQRVYYIFDTKDGVNRGFHAHKNLQQIAVCLAGKCRMVLDDGERRQDFWLNSPSQGLYIGPRIWREIYDFSEDCVLVVFASERYNEADYIRNYDQFLSEVSGV